MLAALMFFTRLPWWRLGSPSKKDFQRVVVYFSWVGWFTGLVMALVFFLSAYIFPVWVAIIFALIARLIMTGCLHEDGLADFFDGFGGGVTKERILEIMKDSHIGTYGVIALIMYFMLFVAMIESNPLFDVFYDWQSIGYIALCLFACDPLSKGIAINGVLLLPYARNEETAKSKIVYDALSVGDRLISLSGALLPLLVLSIFVSPFLLLVAIAPIVTTALLVSLMKRRLQGYTGDCCGATFLMSELASQIVVLMVSCHL
ncbi:adenosylcobinamide-GDP ribazoletransferase [Falsiporphyromonas endometrii]|uniref:Adenosylcobinamide-GDP ribazoletransferase n=1 Tax=Falsiporphyromonas endometrii TaxID=1387297 RepID=A0ABV9K903_9PORP